MANNGLRTSVLFFYIYTCFFYLLLFLTGIVTPATFQFTNNCGYTVWPGILSGASTSALSTTGFPLQSGESKSVSAPSNWSGRMWGRTLCSTDTTTGKFNCVTGDCGSGQIECSGGGAAPPATLAEFTLSGSGGGMDYYDVSLVDGYNLPMLVVPLPQGGSGGKCTSTGCLVDLNSVCPNELKVDEGTACKSACEAFGSPQYCCSGEYGNPNTCKPTSYSLFFKNACPRAYSYAYDDGTSTFTCAAAAGYDVIFCPTTSSLKSAGDDSSSPQATLPLVNDTNMVYFGGDILSGDASTSTAALPAVVFHIIIPPLAVLVLMCF